MTENALCAACPRLGIAGYVFYAPDECNGITVDQRMILVTSEENGVKEIRVSDVTQLLTTATITVEVGEAQILDKSDTVEANVEGGKLVIKVNFEESYGRPYSIRYKS